MTLFRQLLLLVSLLALGTTLQAEEEFQVTRSAGKLKLDESSLKQQLQQREPLRKAIPQQSEDYASAVDSDRMAGIANRHDQLFEIYQADAQLLSDLDGDGFHHAINVSFDVDVNYDDAYVYAKLYLSRDGGSWSQYFTTDLFYIHGDAYADAYEVETELLDGYRTGYYEVLIEIYSLDHAYLVASEVLDYHYLGRDLPLEDLSRDDPWDDGYGHTHGAGSFSLLIFFLIIQVVIAARGSLTLSPLKRKK